jgi:hypothetical protein
MKNIFLTFFGALLYISSIAQSPQKFNYQAVVRNNTGVIVTNQNISIKAEILANDQSTILYSETHAITTNAQGLFSLQVGGGNIIAGLFSSIDWSNGNRYIRTSVDLSGGSNFQLMGTSQLLSVPYALYSKDVPVSVSLSGDTVKIGNHSIIIAGSSSLNDPNISTSINNGLVAYYPFNGNANDESGNGNNGTVNGATLTSDRFGNINKAYNFQKIYKNYISVNYSVGNFGVGDFTISLWVLVKDTSTWSSLINKRYDEDWGNWWEFNQMQQFGTGFGINESNNSNNLGALSDPIKINKDIWYNLVALRNGNTLKIFKNGLLVKTANTSIIHNISNTKKVLIGAIIAPISGTLACHDGKIDDIRIYNRALNQSEISYLANH